MAGPPQGAAAQRAQDRRGAKPPAAPAAPEIEPQKAAKGRSPLVPAVIVAVALLGAAFLLRGGGEPSTVATSPTSLPPAEAAGNPAHVLRLDPVTLNLADGNLAKVGIAIELKSLVILEEVAGEPANFGARALDETISVFGSYTTERITAAGGKDELKAELLERLLEAYHGDVVAVYFTELAIP
jgi:flagellar FliL protein